MIKRSICEDTREEFSVERLRRYRVIAPTQRHSEVGSQGSACKAGEVRMELARSVKVLTSKRKNSP